MAGKIEAVRNKSMSHHKISVRFGPGCGIGALVESTPSNATPGSTVIATRSRRQAMDWSLALASQGIAATILHEPEGDRWSLAVDAPDSQRAFTTLKQYHLENRRWHWEQPLAWTGTMFHWGSGLACLFLWLAHQLTLSNGTHLRQAGVMDNAAFWNGESWRLFTAVTLHADWSHLISNLTTGFLLFGLAMARYGAGPGLLAAFVAGAGGNLAGAMLYARPYQGLGASGMVMGGLGLLAGGAIAHWRARSVLASSPRQNERQAVTRRSATPSPSDGERNGVRGTSGAEGRGAGDLSWFSNKRQALASVAGGLMLFLLLGADPNSDVVAHLGGFVSGCLFGALLGAVPPEEVHRPAVNAAGIVGLIVLLFCAWWQALM